jgi:MFS family permease
MRDIGFSPKREGRPVAEIRKLAGDSIEYGWRNPPVRYLMLAAPFEGGVGIYVFYALQPHLLDLYGDPNAYGVAGLVAAIVAGSQILGGLATPLIRRLFERRTSALLFAGAASSLALLGIGLIESFWPVIALIVVWGLLFAAGRPIRQAFINGAIPSQQRATILSFDSLMNSTGGVVAQPVLGRAADVWGYPASYLMSSGISAMALPFILRARRERAPSDFADDIAPPIDAGAADAVPDPAGPAAETAGTGQEHRG